MEIWQLTILYGSSGPTTVVTGSEELLRVEFDAWAKFKNETVAKWDKKRRATADRGLPEDEYCEIDEDPAEYVVRVIHGYMDTASRSPLELAYRFVNVEGMALVKL